MAKSSWLLRNVPAPFLKPCETIDYDSSALSHYDINAALDGRSHFFWSSVVAIPFSSAASISNARDLKEVRRTQSSL